MAHFGWDDLFGTHLSARIPGRNEFLINPLGLMFDEITASSLVKVHLGGEIVQDTPYAINQAGFIIHSGPQSSRESRMRYAPSFQGWRRRVGYQGGAAPAEPERHDYP